MRFPFNNLASQYQAYKGEILNNIEGVLQDAQYINGPAVDLLENRLADFVGCAHCITCANGTDALVLALRAIGVGLDDEVIVPAFSFFASAEAK